MKKFVSVLLAIAMMLTVVSAYATEINWADLQEQGAELIAQGQFVTFDEIAVKMWIPNAFAKDELTAEDVEYGYIAYYITEDDAYGIGVAYVDVEGMTLEEYKTELVEEGATGIEDVTVNGLPAISFVIEEYDTAYISFVTEAGYLFEVSADPKSDENFASIILFVMASIQPE